MHVHRLAALQDRRGVLAVRAANQRFMGKDRTGGRMHDGLEREGIAQRRQGGVFGGSDGVGRRRPPTPVAERRQQLLRASLADLGQRSAAREEVIGADDPVQVVAGHFRMPHRPLAECAGGHGLADDHGDMVVAGIRADPREQAFHIVRRALQHLEEAAIDMQQHPGDAVALVVQACAGQKRGQLLAAQGPRCGAAIDQVDQVAQCVHLFCLPRLAAEGISCRRRGSAAPVCGTRAGCRPGSAIRGCP